MIIYRSIDDDNDHRGASRTILFFFSFFLLNADQSDWESARVSLVDGMTIRLMRNDVVGEEEQWRELFLSADTDFKIVNKLPFSQEEINWNWISFPDTASYDIRLL